MANPRQFNLGGDLLGWLINMGIDAAEGIPQSVIDRIQGKIGELAEKGKDFALDQIRELVNPNYDVQLMSAALNQFFQRVMNEPEKFPKKIVDGVTAIQALFNPKLLEKKQDLKIDDAEVTVLLKGVWQAWFHFQQAYQQSPLRYRELLTQEQKNDLGIMSQPDMVKQVANVLYNNLSEDEHIELAADDVKKIVGSAIRNAQYDIVLWQAIGQNDATGKAVASALINGANPNYIKNGLSALQQAIFENNYAQVKVLLQGGANVDFTSTNGLWKGWNAVHMAAYENRSEILKLLIEYGADITKQVKISDSKDPAIMKYDGQTALTLALLNPPLKIAKYKPRETELADCVKTLCAHPRVGEIINKPIETTYTGDLIAQSDWRGWTPMCIAAQNWNKKFPQDLQVQMVQVMVQAGANPNQIMQGNRDNWQGFSAMHVLAYNKHKQDNVGREKLFKVMIEQGNGDVQLKAAADTTKGYANKTVLEVEDKRDVRDKIAKMPRGQYQPPVQVKKEKKPRAIEASFVHVEAEKSLSDSQFTFLNQSQKAPAAPAPQQANNNNRSVEVDQSLTESFVKIKK